MAVAPLLIPNMWTNLEHKSTTSIIEEFLSEIASLRKRWFKSSIDEFLSDFERVRNHFWSKPEFGDTWAYRTRIDDFLSEAQELRKRMWKGYAPEDLVVKTSGKQDSIKINVQGYAPEDLVVKTSGNTITVEGKHQVKENNGFLSRNFYSKYSVGSFENLTPVLENGILTLILSKERVVPNERNLESTERVINVKRTGPFEQKPTTQNLKSTKNERIIPIERLNERNCSKSTDFYKSKQNSGLNEQNIEQKSFLRNSALNVEQKSSNDFYKTLRNSGTDEQKIPCDFDKSDQNSGLNEQNVEQKSFVRNSELNEQNVEQKSSNDFYKSLRNSGTNEQKSTSDFYESLRNSGSNEQTTSDFYKSLRNSVSNEQNTSYIRNSGSNSSLNSQISSKSENLKRVRIIPIEREQRDTISICSLDSNATILAADEHQNYRTSESVCSMDEQMTNERIVPIERDYRSSISICSINSVDELK